LVPDKISIATKVLQMIPLAYPREFNGLEDLTLVKKPDHTNGLFGERIPQAQVLEPLSKRLFRITDTGDSEDNGKPDPPWLAQDFAQTESIDFDTAKLLIYSKK
jgi:hypothetical protein